MSQNPFHDIVSHKEEKARYIDITSARANFQYSLGNLFNIADIRHADSLYVGPYSEYIPLAYLLIPGYISKEMFTSAQDFRSFIMRREKSLELEKLLNSPFYRICPMAVEGFPLDYASFSEDDTIKKSMKEAANNYITDDRLYSKRGLFIDLALRSRLNYNQVSTLDLSTGDVASTKQNGYYIMYYPATMIEWNGYYMHPHIMGAIKSEDLVYQRLHILLTGKIDLKRAVVFVNENLYKKQAFSNRGFKIIFGRRMKPFIHSCPAKIIPASLDDIMEKCFIKNRILQSTNVLQAWEEQNSLIDGFVNSLGEAA